MNMQKNFNAHFPALLLVFQQLPVSHQTISTKKINAQLQEQMSDFHRLAL